MFHAQYSADGKTIYVATDGGSEQATVLALDATTGKVVATHDGRAGHGAAQLAHRRASRAAWSR